MPGGLERGHRIGQQRAGVTEHFKLDPVGAGIFETLEDLATEPGDPHGGLGRKAPGGVGEDGVAGEIDEVEDVAAVGVDQPFATHRHGDHLGPARLQALLHQLVGRVFAGADDQAAHQGDDLQSITLDQHAAGVFASRNQFAVAFDRQVTRFESQLFDQPGHRRPGLHFSRLFVDVDLHVDEECTGGSGGPSRKWIGRCGVGGSRRFTDWHGVGSLLCGTMGDSQEDGS